MPGVCLGTNGNEDIINFLGVIKHVYLSLSFALSLQGANVVLPFEKFRNSVTVGDTEIVHPRPFHARGEGGEFDVAEDTPRV